jgi:DNA-binding NarL/FixJ family response regulator
VEVVGEARSGLEAVELTRRHHPDVAILDIGMAPLSGIQAAPKILRESPGTSVLMLTIHRDRLYVVRSLQAGALGYVLKDCDVEVLVQAIRVVSQGKAFVCAEVAHHLGERAGPPPGHVAA